jgi:hypothetical protein
MGEVRARLDIQLAKSITPGSTLVSDSNNEGKWLAPGTNGQVYTVVSGIPTFVDPSTAVLGIYYGSYEITGVLTQFEYLIPYTATTISHFQLTQVENSVGSGYYSDYIAKIDTGNGILVKYDTQPPVGQKIKFNYLIIK